MLTPAEELGLRGLSLATRVRKAFFRIPEARLVELAEQIREEARRRHLFYERDGVEEIIHIMAMPITVLPDQLSYVHYVSQTINNALKRLPDLYFQDFGVREVLRLSDGEEKWLWDCWGPSQRENNPVFSRLDAMVDFISPMWKDSLLFVEPNMSGIGGLHMLPTAEQILAEIIGPVLMDTDEQIELEIGRDIRVLLMQEILEHLQAMDRPAANICFIEPKYAESGPVEQEALAEYYHDRHGLKIMHADPSELTLKDGEVYYQGEAIDLGYRDYAVYDLLELERNGVDIEPMRVLFKQNRIISSITAELDQKSCWEIFTDPQFTQKYFSAEERQIFRRHVLWTRLVADRDTTLPEGETGGLLEYVRGEQERLVMKPNRSYGGQGVVIGQLRVGIGGMGRRRSQKALADPERWVVQQLASIPVSEFPVVIDGKVFFEPFYTVMGFASTRYGVSILGRASQKQVVNVAQRGGLCVVMQGRPPSQLHAPTPAREVKRRRKSESPNPKQDSKSRNQMPNKFKIQRRNTYERSEEMWQHVSNVL